MLVRRHELPIRPAGWIVSPCRAYFPFVKIELPVVEDPVGEALHFLRVSGTFYCRFDLKHLVSCASCARRFVDAPYRYGREVPPHGGRNGEAAAAR